MDVAKRTAGISACGLALFVAVALGLLAGCGARDGTLGPEDFEPPADGVDPADGEGAADGGCAPCVGLTECSHCYIQALEGTYRCPLGWPAPAASCLNLEEVHQDQYGQTYTCFYCP